MRSKFALRSSLSLRPPSLVCVVDEPVALGAALPLRRLDHRRQLVPVVLASATVPIAAERDFNKCRKLVHATKGSYRVQVSHG